MKIVNKISVQKRSVVVRFNNGERREYRFSNDSLIGLKQTPTKCKGMIWMEPKRINHTQFESYLFWAKSARTENYLSMEVV